MTYGWTDGRESLRSTDFFGRQKIKFSKNPLYKPANIPNSFKLEVKKNRIDMILRYCATSAQNPFWWKFGEFWQKLNIKCLLGTFLQIFDLNILQIIESLSEITVKIYISL